MTALWWADVDWSWYLPEDTVWRPTENAAFDNITFQVQMINLNGMRTQLTDIEWEVLLKDIYLKNKYPNARIDSIAIAQQMRGFTPMEIWRIQKSITFVMLVREYLQLPALPPLPAKYKNSVIKIRKLRVA